MEINRSKVASGVRLQWHGRAQALLKEQSDVENQYSNRKHVSSLLEQLFAFTIPSLV